MTETVLDFTTDPTSVLTAETGAFAHDSDNGELDVDTANNYHIRYNTSPGSSLEHEAQVTFLTGTDAAFQAWVGGPMVRGASGAVTGYRIQLKHNADVPGEGGNFFEIKRYVAGVEEEIDDGVGPGFISQAHTINDGEWYTVRMAAEGGLSSTVILKVWIQGHGAAKPSDPGWIGVVDSPDYTFTDPQANRLDDSTHVYCGVGGRNNSSTDYDTRHDFFKQRLLSDRSSSTSLTVENAALTATGQSSLFDMGIVITNATVSFTGEDVALIEGVGIAVDNATLTISGQDVGLSANNSVVVPVTNASVTIEGQDVSFLATIPWTEASLTLTGQDITLTAGVHFTLAVDNASLTFTGGDIDLVADADYSLSVDNASLAITGQDVSFSIVGSAVVLVVENATVVLSGQNIDISPSFTLPATGGARRKRARGVRRMMNFGR